MPTWALQAEHVMEDAELRDGKAPFRCEEVDPLTGEVVEAAIPKPYLDEAERARWLALAEPLWFDSTRTVGRKAGPRGQFRRIGILPFQGEVTTLDDHRKGRPQQGIRALMAGGRWRVQQWEELSKKTGKVLRFSVVLPVGRYAWHPIAAQVWAAMGMDQGGWAQARRTAFRAHANAALDPLAKRDNMHSIREVLDDRPRYKMKTREPWSGYLANARTRRSLVAAELWSSYLTEMRTNPEAVWNETTQAVRRRALELDRSGLLEIEGPTLR